MHSSYLAWFNFECKDEVCGELKLTHHVIFANVLTAMFIFVPATYLRMYMCMYIYIYIFSFLIVDLFQKAM